MKSIDLQAVRSQLPQGSLTKIANQLGIDVRIVSRVFEGEIKNWRDQVLQVAFSLIDNLNDQQKVLNEKAKKLGFLNDFISPIKKKKIRDSDDERLLLDDIFSLTVDEAIEFIDDNKIAVNPDHYTKLLGGYDELGLKNAIAIEQGLYPTKDEVLAMSREELEELHDAMTLDEEINLDDYDNSDDGDNDLAEAIIKELDIPEEDEELNEEE